MNAESTTTRSAIENEPAVLDAGTARRAGVRSAAIRRFLPWVVPVALLAVWQILSSAGVIDTRLFPTPAAVGRAAVHLTQTGELLNDLLVSGRRALLGLLIGGSLGLAAGLINGTARLAEDLFDTTLQMLRTIPTLALLPLVILYLGIGETAKVVLIAIGCFFPIYLNTFYGVRAVDPQLIEMGRIYGLRGGALFRDIVFPAALPAILVGLRFALGVMWLTLIAAETLAADSGIGYMTTNAREFMQTDVVIVGTLLYALLGKAADLLTKFLERKLLPWHPSQARA